MKQFIDFWEKWLVTKKVTLTLVLWCVGLVVFAQTATTDLTTHQPSTVPSGVTLEWHTGVASSSPLVATPTAVAPGLYYAFYNYGSGCFSSPSPLRVLTNTCPTTTVDLNSAVEAAGMPSGSSLKFYSNAALTTELTGSAITAASTGTYYVVYVDGTGCKSNPSVIVMATTTCGVVVCNAGNTAPILVKN